MNSAGFLVTTFTMTQDQLRELIEIYFINGRRLSSSLETAMSCTFKNYPNQWPFVLRLLERIQEYDQKDYDRKSIMDAIMQSMAHVTANLQ